MCFIIKSFPFTQFDASIFGKSISCMYEGECSTSSANLFKPSFLISESDVAEFTSVLSSMYSMATKQNLWAPFQIFNSCSFLKPTSWSAYEVRKNKKQTNKQRLAGFFERPFRIRKNNIFLSWISFFSLEIFAFLYYANEEKSWRHRWFH